MKRQIQSKTLKVDICMERNVYTLIHRVIRDGQGYLSHEQTRSKYLRATVSGKILFQVNVMSYLHLNLLGFGLR